VFAESLCFLQVQRDFETKMPSDDDEKERRNREQDQHDEEAFAEQFYDEEYEQDMNSYGDGDEPPKRGGIKVKGTTPKPPPAPEPTNNPK
jgi:hypothetical protein